MGGFFLNQDHEYFTDIEAVFARRRGKRFTLNPQDWALAESWQDRGVPGHVVVRSIEAEFDARREPRALSFCREQVEIQFTEWQHSHVGGSEFVAVNELCICGKEVCFQIHR